VLRKRVSQINAVPVYPARRAAARLRRALDGPILAAPPVREIQTSILLESKRENHRIVLNGEENSVYKERNYWLVLTRPSVAGFNAPIDTVVEPL